MTDTGPFMRISRLMLTGLIIVSPLFGAGAVGFILILVSSVSVYDGLNRGTVYGVIAALIGTELIYGMDVGVLSVSYMVSVLAFALLNRFVTITPASSEPGWRLGDGVRSLVSACGMFAILSVCSVLLGRILYGYEDIGLRLHRLTDPWSAVIALFGIVVTLIILRRIDEPFRRRILFGT